MLCIDKYKKKVKLHYLISSIITITLVITIITTALLHTLSYRSLIYDSKLFFPLDKYMIFAHKNEKKNIHCATIKYHHHNHHHHHHQHHRHHHHRHHHFNMSHTPRRFTRHQEGRSVLYCNVREQEFIIIERHRERASERELSQNEVPFRFFS